MGTCGMRVQTCRQICGQTAPMCIHLHTARIPIDHMHLHMPMRMCPDMRQAHRHALTVKINCTACVILDPFVILDLFANMCRFYTRIHTCPYTGCIGASCMSMNTSTHSAYVHTFAHSAYMHTSAHSVYMHTSAHSAHMHTSAHSAYSHAYTPHVLSHAHAHASMPDHGSMYFMMFCGLLCTSWNTYPPGP